MPAAGLHRPLEQAEVRVAQGARVVRAAAGGGQERALEVDARDRPVVGEIRCGADGLEQLGLARRDQAGQQGRRAVRVVVRRHGVAGRSGAVGEGVADRAVGVHVDQPGQQRAAGGLGRPVPVRRRPHLRQPPVADHDDAVVEHGLGGDDAPAQGGAAGSAHRAVDGAIAGPGSRKAPRTPAREPSSPATIGGTVATRARRRRCSRTGSMSAGPAADRPAAEHHPRRGQQRDGGEQAVGEGVGGLVPGLVGGAVAAEQPADVVGTGHGAAGQVLVAVGDRARRGDRLQAAVLPARAGGSAGSHDDVPDLAGLARAAADEASVADDRRGDAGADHDDEQVVDLATGAEAPLRGAGAGDVVPQHDGHAGGVRDHLRHRGVAPAEVRRQDARAGRGVDQAGDRERRVADAARAGAA